ncbi:nuclear envelope pore membrane protein POM 121-like [Pseudophryne corroboree]|uniref:nuclear envelope pore membrane protein POM 121-like n=1 Tax=Pseudophryne corroboree TaxID=495146 RepID=UPI00308195A2
MPPSGGKAGGIVWCRLRRSLREVLGRGFPQGVLLLPLLAAAAYLFPLLSALTLCVAAGCCVYYSSERAAWRLPEWRELCGWAAGRRLRPVPQKRQREPVQQGSRASRGLLMGSYLGTLEPPARGRGTRDLPERMRALNPALHAPALPHAIREKPVFSNRTFVCPRRRYPTHQPKYYMSGILPTVYSDDYPRKPVLLRRNSMVHSSVIIPHPGPSIYRSPILDKLLPVAPDPCAKETVLNAIRESRKRMNKDEYNDSADLESNTSLDKLLPVAPDPCTEETVLTAIRQSRKRTNNDEEYSDSDDLENNTRMQTTSGSAESSFESSVANYATDVLMSDNLKRGLSEQPLDDNVMKRSRTSSDTSFNSIPKRGFPNMHSHNVITSSYSSLIYPLQKSERSSPNTPAVSSSSLSRSQTPDVSARPDTLKRGPNAQPRDDHVTKRSRTSSKSSFNNIQRRGFPNMHSHNVITSSYSSLIYPLQKRKSSTRNTPAVSSSSSSRSQTPDVSAKKARDESHEISPSSPVGLSNREQSGQLNEADSSKSPAVNSSFKNWSEGTRRRKVLLTCPPERVDRIPPPALPLGRSISSKEYDDAKKESLERLYKALEDKTDPVPVSSGSSTNATSTVPPSLFSLPPTTSGSFVLPTSTANSNSLLQSLAEMQNKDSSQVPTQNVVPETLHLNVVPTLTAHSLNEPCKTNSMQPPSKPAPTATATLGSTIFQPVTVTQPKSESPKTTLANTLQNDVQSTFKQIFPSNEGSSPPIVSSNLSTTSVPATNINQFKPISGDQNSQQGQPANTFKPIFGDSTAQQPVSSAVPFTFNLNSAATAPTTSFSGFSATVMKTTHSTDSSTKLSQTLPTSNSSTTSFSLLFPSAATSNSVTASGNPFIGSSTITDSQSKSTYESGQKLQETQNLPVFSNAQTVPTSTSHPQQSTMVSSAANFLCKLGTEPPPYPANTGAPTFNSSPGSGVQADKPTTNPLAGFGASGGPSAFGTGAQSTSWSSSLPTVWTNTQSAFGTNTNFSFGPTLAGSNGTTFSNQNTNQTNSTPSNLFGVAKPFTFMKPPTNTVTFDTNTAPAADMSSLFPSVAQNRTDTPMGFGTPVPTENNPPYVLATPSFGQSPSTGPSAIVTSTPAAFASPVSSFSQAAPGFSIGLTSSRHSATRQRTTRRQHPRKK